MNNHSFDDLIRQKTSAHEAPVPTGTWEAIAEKKKKKRRYPFFWWITGVALLSGGILLLLYNNQSETKKTQQTNTATAIETRNSAQNINTETGTINSTDNTVNIDNTDNTDNRVSEEQKKQTAVVLKERKKQDISSSSSSSINRRTAGVSRSDNNSNSGTNNMSGGGSITNDHHQFIITPAGIGTGDDLFSESSSASFNYNEHNNIAGRGIRKQLDNNSPGINKLLTPGADSIKDKVDAAIAAIRRKPVRNKWTVDISVMPFLPLQQTESLLYLTRTTVNPMQLSEYKTDRVDTRLQPSVAYTVSIHKKVSPRLRIGAGLQYAMIKEKVDLTGKETRVTYTEIQRLVNGSGGPQLVLDTIETISSGVRNIDALNSYRFISIPLSVQYRLMERGSWSLQVNGGLMLNISAKYNNSIEGKLVRFDGQGIHNSKQSNIGVDLFAGLRVSKNYRSFRLFAEPALRYNVRRYDLAGMINRKFMHQAGLSFGLSYTLGY